MFGAFKNKVKSPSQVCVILKFTLALDPTALAGTPDTVNGVLTPAALASGIATVIGPEDTVTVPGVADNAVNNAGSPEHNVVPTSDVITIGPTPAATKLTILIVEYAAVHPALCTNTLY